MGKWENKSTGMRERWSMVLDDGGFLGVMRVNGFYWYAVFNEAGRAVGNTIGRVPDLQDAIDRAEAAYFSVKRRNWGS